MAKYKSRATRAGEAFGNLTAVADDLRNAETYEAAKAALDKLDTSEVESLAEEMQSWRDNTEEKFGSTEKWQMVSDAADALEQVLDTLQSLDELTEPEPDSKPSLPADAAKAPKEGEAGEVEDDEDAEGDDGPAWKEEAESIADEIESAASELDSVEFPGMY